MQNSSKVWRKNILIFPSFPYDNVWLLIRKKNNPEKYDNFQCWNVRTANWNCFWLRETFLFQLFNSKYFVLLMQRLTKVLLFFVFETRYFILLSFNDAVLDDFFLSFCCYKWRSLITTSVITHLESFRRKQWKNKISFFLLPGLFYLYKVARTWGSEQWSNFLCWNLLKRFSFKLSEVRDNRNEK
jgi:hypothetical protein